MLTESRFARHDKIAPFPAPSNAPSLQGIFSGQPLEAVEAGATVFWDGEEVGHVFTIVEGVLRLFKILPDGRRVVTRFAYPGDLLGISLKDHYLCSAEAVTAMKLRRVARAQFRDQMDRSAELRPLLLSLLCDEAAAAQDQITLLARKTAEERVSSFLLGSARRLSNDGDLRSVVDIPMTRQDMADHLGLTIETVSRTMTKLASGGVIVASGRHAITIRKPRRLAVLAGEGDASDSMDRNSRTNVVRPAFWSHHA
jgi:CRP/FNR family transcriptional regulator